jgi:hypothetical protein
MGITDYALNTFVAQQMSSFVWTPRSVGSEFPNRATWLDEFVRRRIFHAHVPDDRAALAFIMVRRALAAIEEWESMCVGASGSMRRPSVYFSALRHCEGCLAATWQALEFGRKALGEKLFEKGDGTVYERLNAVYNVGRHFNPEALPGGALHAVWLAGECVRTQEHELHLDELREVVCMLGRIASKIVIGPGQPANSAMEPTALRTT